MEGTQEFNVGEEACFRFVTDGFDDVFSFQFAITFDPSVFCMVNPPGGFIDLGGGLNGPIFSAQVPESGLFTIIYSSQTKNGTTLPDGTPLFQICLKAIGEPGECSNIYTTVFNNLGSIEFTNNTGCIYEPEPTTIDQACIVSNDMNIISGACNTETNTGSVTTKVYNGSAPYDVELKDVTQSVIQSTTITNELEEHIFTNLSPGNYTICVTDSNGTETTENVAIDNTPALTVSLSCMAPSCWNFNNGHIATNVEGGFPGAYSYEWSNQQFLDSIYKLTTGLYELTVTDESGCEVTASKELIKPELVVDINTTQASCCEIGDGSIEVTCSGGTPFAGNEYTISIKPLIVLNFMGDNLLQQNLPKGDYQVLVVDADGCTFRDSVFITPAIDSVTTSDFVVVNNECFGDSTGSVLFDFEQQGPYTSGSLESNGVIYTPSNTDALNGIFEFDGLPNGTYNWSAVITSNQCSFDTTFTIDSPPKLVLSGGSLMDNTSCTLPNGNVTVSAMGGFGNYMYNWNPDVTNDFIFDNATAGEYKITVTDEYGCQDSTTVIVDGTQIFDVGIIVDSAIGCNGTALGGLTGVISDLLNKDYTWTKELEPTFLESTLSIGGLDEGTYIFTVIDVITGCENADTITLNQVVDLSLSTSQSNPSCANSDDGLLSISVVGGEEPYSAMWADFVSNELTIDTAGCGTFNVTITDLVGCTADTFITLDCPPAITIDTSGSAGVTCFDSFEGMMTATSAGGISPGGPYNYYWSSNICQELGVVSSTCNGLPKGLGWVVSEDGNGCLSDTLFFIIDGPDELTLSSDTDISSPACKGECDGAVNLDITGGTLGVTGYSVLWPDGNMDINRTGLCAGSYTLTLTDGALCTSEVTIELDEPAMPFVVEIDSLISANISCPGDLDGRIRLKVEGGSGNPGNFTYEWFPDVSDNISAINLPASNYSITVTDELGCAKIVDFEIQSPDALSLDIDDIDPISCAGGNTCIRLTNIAGGTGPGYQFQLNNQAPLLPIDTCLNIFAGNYLVSLFDELGCSTDTIIMVNEPNAIEVDLGDDFTLDLGADTILTADIDSDLSIINFQWSDNEDINCEAIDCSSVSILPPNNQLYSVTVTDENNCIGSDEIFITLSEVRDIFQPNIFSPIMDGPNSKLMIQVGKGVESINYFKVYDRWGTMVYSIENIDPNDVNLYGWDGSFNGKELNVGVYVYTASIQFIDGKEYIFTQDVTLVR